MERTKDGFESTMGVNYLGHFLLAELLLDVLKKTRGSRVVMVSSVVHAGTPKNRPKLHLDDLNYEKRKFKNFGAYAEAKLAGILYAMELNQRLKDSGATAYSVHPGWARSNFGKGGGFLMRFSMVLAKPLTRCITDSNEASAQTTLHCLLSDDALKHSGKYFSQSSVLYKDKGYKQGGWPIESPNPNARDVSSAKKLVEMSRELVGLK